MVVFLAAAAAGVKLGTLRARAPVHNAAPVLSRAEWRARTPVARAAPVLWPVDTLDDPDEHFVHVHGIPWELGNDETIAALRPMIPSCDIVEATLPLDKRARSTSRVLLRLIDPLFFFAP